MYGVLFSSCQDLKDGERNVRRATSGETLVK